MKAFTVLLVEDDRWLGECYEGWLKDFGYKVQWVRNAQAALDALDEVKIDIILLDIMLPFANGIHLLNVMASHSDLQRIPVIICSSMPPTKRDIAAYGVRVVLDKTTLTPKRLQIAISKTLSHAAVQN